jgi:hypothetical protein
VATKEMGCALLFGLGVRVGDGDLLAAGPPTYLCAVPSPPSVELPFLTHRPVLLAASATHALAFHSISSHLDPASQVSF